MEAAEGGFPFPLTGRFEEVYTTVTQIVVWQGGLCFSHLFWSCYSWG